MRLTVLYKGYLETDKNTVVALATQGTQNQPHVENEWIKLPVQCFLIEMDDRKILYDTGCSPCALTELGCWSAGLFQGYPLTQPEESRLENQLVKCGISPESGIVSSSYGPRGQYRYVRERGCLRSPGGLWAGQLAVHMNPAKAAHGAYIKEEIEAPVKQVYLVDEDFELAPGVEVLNLPGHTDGLLGIMVHLNSGTVILPQDCLYLAENYGGPTKASGLMADNKAYFETIEKVRKLQKKYDAKIFYAYDWEFFQTLKTAPEYYE